MTVMRGRGCLVWDFDGTLATRPGAWTGTLCEVVTHERPDLGVTPESVRAHLQSGFRWHTPEIVRSPCSEDQWWDELLPVFAGALRSGAGLHEGEALRLARNVRARYTDPSHWRVFDDVTPVLTHLRDRGWRHILLSNHIPELAQLVDALGLGDFFVAVYSSGRIGVEKPHPGAFEAVFAKYPEARGGWMIGDSWRADVQGARAVGMRAILVRSTHPEATVRCETMEDIAPIVEGV
jgi:putative hydrolase of the HAD superfamily